MCKLRTFVALTLIYVMLPGTSELTENLFHLVANGHLAHAIDDADHEPKGDEHGCSGPFHVCQCHSSTGFVLADASLVLDVPETSQTFWGELSSTADGHLSNLFRPPIA